MEDPVGTSADVDPLRFQESTGTAGERHYRRELEEYFTGSSVGSTYEKLDNFPKYVPRQALTRFLFRYELFRRILGVQGSVVECGVLFGGGLMAWAQLSAILEPVNHQRRIIGFDTFDGFVRIAAEDRQGTSGFLRAGDYAVDSYADLREAVRLFDANRSTGHISKVDLVKGDITTTARRYLEDHPSTVVSLLYLDLDLFEPTKAAIELFVPRMPRGALIAFDQLNSELWPGETLAVLQSVGIRNLRIERPPFETARCFAVLE
jgi:hypothetical protein